MYRQSLAIAKLALLTTSLVSGLALGADTPEPASPTTPSPTADSAQSDKRQSLELHLHDALRLAIERNPDITAAELDIRLARIQARRARLDRMAASVDLAAGDSVSYYLSKDEDSTTMGGNYGLSAQLSIPLYAGGSVKAGIERADLGVKSEKLARELTVRELLRAVYTTYWNIQGSDLQIAAAEEAIVKTREALAISEAKQNSGLAAPIELNRIQVDLLSQDQQLEELRLNAYLARQNLLELLNLKEGELTLLDSASDESSPFRHQKLNALLELAHRKRPELRAIELKKLTYDKDKIIARSSYLPYVSLDVTADGGADPQWVDGVDFDSDQLSPALTFTGGVNLSWNLFSLWQTDEEVEKVEIAQEKLNAEREGRIARIDNEVKEAVQQLETLRKRQPGVEKQLELARDNLNIIQSLYGQGSSTILDLFEAQKAYRSALVQEASFRINLAVARHELQWVLGEEIVTTGKQ